MASTPVRLPPSRLGTPIIQTHQSRPTVSLEEWESKTGLSDAELRSVALLQKACKEKVLPFKEKDNEINGISSRPSTPTAKLKNPTLEQPSSSRPPTPSAFVRSRRSDSLIPDRPIQSTQEFYDWFSVIERSVTHSQEAHYREYLEMVGGHLSECSFLANGVDSVDRDVGNMIESWRSVESGGRNLKEACEALLDERDRLIRLSEDIGTRLEYFQELERATQLLNHPGESLVLQSDFLEVVERVDICIGFLLSHRHYKDSDIYLLRFQQCLTRAMTLIKMYFVGSLKALTSDISRRMPDKQVSSTTQMHLLYTRFQTVAVQVAPLIGELERRARSYPEDLESLLTECHSAYFSARRTLLLGRLAEEIRGLDPTRADLVELTRSGCTFLKQLCMDEFTIYRAFFNSGRQQLYGYLESLCDYLYDDLRPRILHEPKLTVLCDVCRVLQALMVLDVPDADGAEDVDEEELDGKPMVNGSPTEDKGLGRLHISHMLRSVLQDAQTRLFFKAQAVVQSDIRYYVPKPEDVNYPEILERPRRTRPNSSEQPSNLSSLSHFQESEDFETWYTPLQTTVRVLAQLIDFVQRSIFDDIAREAIEFCRWNLGSGSNAIIAKGAPAAQVDSQLFLVRHLLVLKELIAVLDLSGNNPDGPIEFHHVTETLKDILRSTNLGPSAFASSLSKIRGGDVSNTGAKESVDDDLRVACESVIQLYARVVTLPIQNFMMTLDGPRPSHDISATAEKSPQSGGERRDVKAPLPSLSAALDIDRDFRATLEQEVPLMKRRLALFLSTPPDPSDALSSSQDLTLANEGNSGTVSVLLGHIQERIVDAYVAFRKAVEFLPADETPAQQVLSFMAPESVRELVRDLH